MKKAAKRTFIRDAQSIFTSKVGVLLISLVNGILLARLLGPEGKGMVTAILVYPTLLVSLFEMGIRQSVIYHVGRADFDRNAVVGTITWFFIGTSVIGAFITLLLMLPRFGVYPSLAVVFAIALVPLRLLRSYAGGMMVGGQQMSSFSKVLWLPPFIGLIGTAVLVWYLGMGVVGAIAATLTGSIVVAIYVLVVTVRTAGISLQFSASIASQLLRMGLLYAVSLFVINLNYKIDILFLERMTNPAEVGYYSLGVRFGELVWQIPSAVGVVVFARSAAAKGSQTFSLKILRLFRVVLVACAVSAVFLWIAADWFIPFLYSDRYVPSISMMRLLLPGIVAIVLFKVLNFDMAGRGKPLFALKAAIPALVGNVVLNLLLIPQHGGDGAAVASALSYTLFSMLYIIMYVREIGTDVRTAFSFSLSDFAVLRRKR